MAQQDPAPEPMAPVPEKPEKPGLLGYYSAIEQASENMLAAARSGDWELVMRLEGACAVLISQLRHAACDLRLSPEEARLKHQMMLRILRNDAEIRHLTEPWLEDLARLLADPSRPLH